MSLLPFHHVACPTDQAEPRSSGTGTVANPGAAKEAQNAGPDPAYTVEAHEASMDAELWASHEIPAGHAGGFAAFVGIVGGLGGLVDVLEGVLVGELEDVLADVLVGELEGELEDETGEQIGGIGLGAQAGCSFLNSHWGYT
jgi:hypothetical protein